MANTRPADLDLAALEREHEAFNARRGELGQQRRKLEERAAKGEALHRELRRVEREIAEVDEAHDRILPAFQDARRIQNDAIRRAGRIDQLERQIAVWEDVRQFQAELVTIAGKYLAPHLTAWHQPTHGIPERYAAIAREALAGAFHENGSNSTAVQLRTRLDRARRELAQLRAGDL